MENKKDNYYSINFNSYIISISEQKNNLMGSGPSTSNEVKENEKKETEEDMNAMIYSTDKKKVCIDDFAVLKLIGKGNFASVI